MFTVTLLTLNTGPVGKRGWRISDTLNRNSLSEARQDVRWWEMRHGHKGEIRDLDGNLV